jgi:hypothetical protein
MGDYRKIEIIIIVIGARDNEMTDEATGKTVSVRKIMAINEELSVEDVAKLFTRAITRVEEEN